MRRIHYIGFYIGKEFQDDYSGNVPGMLKMRYIEERMLEAGYTPEILSLATANRNGVYLQKKVKQGCGDKVIYTPGFGGTRRTAKLLNLIIKRVAFIKYIIFHTHKDDVIVLYHSKPYTDTMALLKRVCNRNVICEVEEIYGYNAVEDKPWVQDEINSILRMDKFILVNEGMIERLGLKKDRCVVSYGVCNYVERTIPRYTDGKIHVIYAGTVEKKKLGAISAVKAAEYLPEKYIMHIIGFGTKENIDYLEHTIKDINRRVGSIKVQYDGFYSGSALDDELFKCHIGLSSNVMRPNFANNSFPSKVMTYMCHGLSVVLGYADAFGKGTLADKWTFYYSHNPKEIAEAISSAPLINDDYYRGDLEKMNEELIAFLRREN